MTLLPQFHLSTDLMGMHFLFSSMSFIKILKRIVSEQIPEKREAPLVTRFQVEFKLSPLS